MTFTIKVRTSPGAPMTAEYRCPVHGLFELTVRRDANGDPPAEVLCSARVEARMFALFGASPEMRERLKTCRKPSPWCISAPGVHTQFVISASQGRPDPKPHPHSMDTRMLAEGRRNDFRRQRKAIREANRHRRVKELLK